MSDSASSLDLERFNRLQGIIDHNTIRRLNETHVLIAGVGGSGGQLAADLARMGIGCLTLADFDVYERHNMNRQIGCFESTLGRPKVEVVAGLCQDINPAIRIRTVPKGITAENANALLEACGDFPAPTFVAELIDILGVRAKTLLHAACRKRQVIALTAPMIGFGAAVFVFHPAGPSFEEILSDGKQLRFDRLVPQLGSYMDLRRARDCVSGQATTPTCIVGATLASSLMLVEIMRGLILGPAQMLAAPEYIYCDLFDRKISKGLLLDLGETRTNPASL